MADRRCGNCGAFSHSKRDCTEDVRCYRCSEFNHKYYECPNPELAPKYTWRIKYGNWTMTAYFSTDVPLTMISSKAFGKMKTIEAPAEVAPWQQLTLLGQIVTTYGTFSGHFSTTHNGNTFPMGFAVVDEELLAYQIILGQREMKMLTIIFEQGSILQTPVVHADTKYMLVQEPLFTPRPTGNFSVQILCNNSPVTCFVATTITNTMCCRTTYDRLGGVWKPWLQPAIKIASTYFRPTGTFDARLLVDGTDHTVECLTFGGVDFDHISQLLCFPNTCDMIIGQSLLKNVRMRIDCGIIALKRTAEQMKFYV